MADKIATEIFCQRVELKNELASGDEVVEGVCEKACDEQIRLVIKRNIINNLV